MADHYFPNENLTETQFKVQLCDIIIEIPKLSNLVPNIINSYNLCLINYSITMADLKKKKKFPVCDDSLNLISSPRETEGFLYIYSYLELAE